MTALQWSNLLPDLRKGCLPKAKTRCYRRASARAIGLFPGSSAVEQLTVNQLAGGSNPSRGAIFPLHQAPSLP